MSVIAKLLLRLLTQKVAQQVIVVGLEEAAKRSSNKIDDEIVKAVRVGLDMPAQRECK